MIGLRGIWLPYGKIHIIMNTCLMYWFATSVTPSLEVIDIVINTCMVKNFSDWFARYVTPSGKSILLWTRASCFDLRRQQLPSWSNRYCYQHLHGLLNKCLWLSCEISDSPWRIDIIMITNQYHYHKTHFKRKGFKMIHDIFCSSFSDTLELIKEM